MKELGRNTKAFCALLWAVCRAGRAISAIPVLSFLYWFGARPRPSFVSIGFETDKCGKLERNTETLLGTETGGSATPSSPVKYISLAAGARGRDYFSTCLDLPTREAEAKNKESIFPFSIYRAQAPRFLPTETLRRVDVDDHKGKPVFSADINN